MKSFFFDHYVLVAKYADNGQYSHTDLVRKHDGVNMIEDCLLEGAKNTEQANQLDPGE